jgi:hypothetical protein
MTLTVQEVNSGETTTQIAAKPQYHEQKQGLTVTVPDLNSKGSCNQPNKFFGSYRKDSVKLYEIYIILILCNRPIM